MTPQSTYLSDPAYPSAQRHLQHGQWADGLASLQVLAEGHPHDTDLRTLIDETTVRAKVDQDEVEDRRRARVNYSARWAARLTILLVLIAGLSWGARTYSVWIQEQVTFANQVVAEQADALQLALQYADAQALLRAGRYGEAVALLEAVATVDPAYPGVQMLINQANLMNMVDARYAEATRLMQAQEWEEALSILRQLFDADPNYRDVELLLAEAEKRLLLNDLVVDAEAKFAEALWVEAALAYEGVRAVDPAHEQALVERRLFEAYVQSARAALVGQEDSLEALRTAEAYFRKALALRPQNPEIKAERELARLFLLAQDQFDAAQWSDVITSLGIVIGFDPNYANGSAHQTLYEAYTARGDASMAVQAYEDALSDYEASLALAELDRSAMLRLYEGYLRVGDAHAALGQTEAAVLMYRRAIELGGVQRRAADDTLMAEALRQAEEAFDSLNFGLAYENYLAALHEADATQATVIHVVQPGEYLILIATRYQSTVQAIVAANDIPNPRLIYAGQRLVIPVEP